MKKGQLGCRIFCFSVLFCVLFGVLELFFFDPSAASSTWDDLQNPDTVPPDILFMGNSHTFVSTDVELISQSTGLKVETLGSPAQNMTVAADNLKILLNYKKPGAVVLEVNAPILANMDTLLGIKRGYLLENYDGIHNYDQKLDAVRQRFPLENLPEAMFQLCRPTYTWTRFQVGKSVFHSDILGNKLKIGYNPDAGYEEEHAELTLRNYEESSSLPIADYNEKALREFLEITKREQIPVYLYKNITAPTNPTTSRRIAYVKGIGEEYENVTWLGDLNLYTDEIGLNVYDFWDSSHLNRRGAVKGTVYLTALMEKAGLCRPDYSFVFHYKSETVTQLENGLYRYQIENFANGTRYEFLLTDNGLRKTKKKFSAENYIDLPELLSKTQTLTIRMIPQSCDPEDPSAVSEQNITLPFMKCYPAQESTLMN